MKEDLQSILELIGNSLNKHLREFKERRCIMQDITIDIHSYPEQCSPLQDILDMLKEWQRKAAETMEQLEDGKINKI